jgi:hypothetical protein
MGERGRMGEKGNKGKRIKQDLCTQPKKPGFLGKYFLVTHRFSQKPGFWSHERKS